MALTLPVAIVLVGLCVDLARLWAVRTALQAAVDAACLAGVDGANAWARLDVTLERVVCTPGDAGGPPTCGRQQRLRTLSAEVARLEGGAWREPAGCGVEGWVCAGVRVDQTWVVLADQASEEAASTFALAAERLAASGVTVGAPSVTVDQAAAKVAVTAQAAVPTVFAGLLGRPTVTLAGSGTAAARVRAADIVGTAAIREGAGG